MITNEQIKNLCSRLRLYALPRLLESEAHLAQEQGKNHVEFLHDLLSREVQERDSKDFQRRLKAAALPARHDLDLFDHNYSQGITAPRLRELRRLGWLEQNYNLILMGPSGTGKTFIAAGLVYEAAGQGYKAYMVTMEDVINTIKMKTLMPSAMSAYNRLLKADLVAIDDIMLFPVKKEDAAGFFNLINTLHEKATLIITTNKAPTEWGKTLDDEVLASAILDRLLYHYEVIKLTGQSYRMGNRKSIFEEEKDRLIDRYGILRCGRGQFSAISPEDYITCRSTNMSVECLVPDKEAARRKYKNTIVDNASLEDIMLFYIKGGHAA